MGHEDDKKLDLDYIKSLYNDGGEGSAASERTDGNGTSDEEREQQTAAMGIYDWVQCIVSALICGIFVFMLLARVIGVIGSSMYPTLWSGDKVITSNLFYKPKQGDVIVLQTDTFGEEPIVKRIIAMGGQTVDIDFSTGAVYVDGVQLEEDYINDLTHQKEDFSGEVTVPDGCVFVMGDNRNASTDSRSNSVGFVDERCIIGRVLLIVIPGADSSHHRSWSRIGGVD